MTAAKPDEQSTMAGLRGNDHRLERLDVAMKRHQFRQDALIEVLHTAQELFGSLSHDLLYCIARGLRLPPGRVYGVATFYHLFTLTPKGRHTCVVCTGTACYVLGANDLLAATFQDAQIAAGETTDDGKVSLMTARCLGACGNAPVLVLDGMIVGHQTPNDLHRWMEGRLHRGPDGSG